MSSHRGEDLDQHSRTITTGGEQFQIPHPGHGRDHRRFPGQLLSEVAGCVPGIQDHYIARKGLAYDADLGGDTDPDRVGTERRGLFGQPAQTEAVAVPLDHRNDAWCGARHCSQVLPPAFPVKPQGYTAHVVNTMTLIGTLVGTLIGELITDVSCRDRKPCTTGDSEVGPIPRDTPPPRLRCRP